MPRNRPARPPAQACMVGVCHVLRYHPYFAKIQRAGRLRGGWDTSFRSTILAVGRTRPGHPQLRARHLPARERSANPILLAKCCHDIDFLLWLTEVRAAACSRRSGRCAGSVRRMLPKAPPRGVIDCRMESECPFSAARPLLRPPRLGLELRRAARSDARCDDYARTAAHGQCCGRCVYPLRQRRGRSPAAFRWRWTTR